MASLVEVYLRVTVSDSSGLTQNFELPVTRFGLGVGALPVVQEVSLTGSAFTALVVPAGARAVLLRTGTNPSLTLKADAGSTNIPITPPTNVLPCDQFLTLGSSPVLGIFNGGATVVIPVVFF